MKSLPPAVFDRAAILAASGRYGSLLEIQVQLKLEGYGGKEIAVQVGSARDVIEALLARRKRGALSPARHDL